MNDTLDLLINELLTIEPFWKMCYPCSSAIKGFCCKGARISTSEQEAEIIRQHLNRLSPSDAAAYKINIALGIKCPYRTKAKCLISEVRPENCRYTPFQCAFDENILRYSMVKKGILWSCRFRTMEVPMTPDQLKSFLTADGKFALLKNFDRKTYYLSLNYLYGRASNWYCMVILVSSVFSSYSADIIIYSIFYYFNNVRCAQELPIRNRESPWSSGAAGRSPGNWRTSKGRLIPLWSLDCWRMRWRAGSSEKGKKE